MGPAIVDPVHDRNIPFKQCADHRFKCIVLPVKYLSASVTHQISQRDQGNNRWNAYSPSHST
jgi:hypothetical protein